MRISQARNLCAAAAAVLLAVSGLTASVATAQAADVRAAATVDQDVRATFNFAGLLFGTAAAKPSDDRWDKPVTRKL
jgi:hypothetical protein